jgi:hypothetical protein
MRVPQHSKLILAAALTPSCVLLTLFMALSETAKTGFAAAGVVTCATAAALLAE